VPLEHLPLAPLVGVELAQTDVLGNDGEVGVGDESDSVSVRVGLRPSHEPRECSRACAAWKPLPLEIFGNLACANRLLGSVIVEAFEQLLAIFVLGVVFGHVWANFIARHRAFELNRMWVVAVANAEATRIANAICNARIPMSSERETIDLKPGRRPELPDDERYTTVFRPTGAVVDREI